MDCKNRQSSFRIKIYILFAAIGFSLLLLISACQPGGDATPEPREVATSDVETQNEAMKRQQTNLTKPRTINQAMQRRKLTSLRLRKPAVLIPRLSKPVGVAALMQKLSY
jgi:hypothetical protein